MTDIIIRPIEIDELDILVRLCADHADYEQSGYDETGKIDRLRMGLFSERPAVHVLVAEVDQTIIGYVSFMRQYATWDADYYLYLDCLYIDADYRNHGIGALLMTAVQHAAQTMGCTQIQWQTPDFNKGAIRFYKRLGAHSKPKERFFWRVQSE